MSAGTEQQLESALAWASRGVAVLPARAGGKAPLTRHGLRDATTDPSLLRHWWARWPGANVAIATGAPGVDVLDVDVRGTETGWPALRRLREAGILPGGGPVVRTPSDGIHMHFIGTSQRNGSLHHENLDFRAAGGYVLVPPSFVDAEAYAGTYRWERQGTPNARLDWEAATELLRPTAYQLRSKRPLAMPRQGWDVNTLAAAVEREPFGNRNNLLFWAFCEAIRCGYDLRPIADAALRNPHGERITVREVEATWKQAVKRVARDGQADRSPAPTTGCRISTVHSPARQI